MISSGIDESEELLVLCSSSTKSLFSFGTLGFSSDGEMGKQFMIWCIGDHNIALGFNLLEFLLFPNGPNWFPLSKAILISDDSPIDSLN